LIRRALQQIQQHQCIIYCMHCQSLLSENSGQISIRDFNTECMQIEFEFYNRSSKITSQVAIVNRSLCIIACCTELHCESKTCHSTPVHDFGIRWPIFTILSSTVCKMWWEMWQMFYCKFLAVEEFWKLARIM